MLFRFSDSIIYNVLREPFRANQGCLPILQMGVEQTGRLQRLA